MDCCKNSKKNKEIMISGNMEKSLQDWKLPRSSASNVFKRRGIFNFSPDWEVKTVEKQIPLNEGYTTISLIPDSILNYWCQKFYSFAHVGMIQVGLKPTKLGSNITATILLRDDRFLKFDQSVLAMVESSLSDGPIYFTYFPTHCVARSDLSSSFVIDTETEGCSGDEGMILMYRAHYKVMRSFCLDTKNWSRSKVDGIGETTLYIADIARGNRVVSKKITRHDNAMREVRDKAEEWKETEEEAYVLEVDVGGLKKDEVKVEVEDGRFVVIKVERSREEEEEGKRNVMEQVKFPRRLRLPENAKSEELKAALENGVLTVTVPKEEGGKKVQVKVVAISG